MKTDHEWRNFSKTETTPMRSYVPGEDLEAQGISVWDGDVPEEGGMIAMNRNNPLDQWYVSKDYFEANYRPAAKEKS